MQPPTIRLATAADLPAINAIYNHYVPISTTTYDYEPMPLEERQRWFARHDAIHPVTVAYHDVEELTSSLALSPQPPAPTIVGWGSLHTFRNKPGYRLTVENSVYVHPDNQREGIGSAILLDQIARARALGLRAIVAGIDAEQTASLALHYKRGFREVGRFGQIGYKFDRWLDVIFMELILE
ncbi:MAG: N-acetyltransferase [Pirellulales bacterium]|nr:N-acetyltransferase [Pirellulales bacterium]